MIQQYPLADGDPHLVQHQRLVSTAGGGLKPERHGAVFRARLAQPAHPFQPPPASLGLGAVLPCDVSADEIFLRRDRAGLLVERALVGQPPLGSLAHEALVVAGVGVSGAGLEVEHVVDHRLEEDPVVADEEHRGVEPGEILLQPASGLEIEVIGRLVQQKHVGRAHQLLHQPQPAALASAQAAERLGASLVRIEAEAVQHRVDPGSQGVAAIALESLQVAVVARQHRRGAAVSRLSQRLTLPRQRPLQLQQLGEVARGCFPDRARSRKLPMLIHQRHPKSSAPRHRPPRGLGLARDEAEQRSLAAAVPPDDPPLLSPGDGKGHVLEERGRSEFDGHSRERELGHEHSDADWNFSEMRCGK